MSILSIYLILSSFQFVKLSTTSINVSRKYLFNLMVKIAITEVPPVLRALVLLASFLKSVGTPGHWDTGTMGGVGGPTYRNLVVIFVGKPFRGVTLFYHLR